MPQETNLLNNKGLFDLGRNSALTDGVFAIVVTLLVLGIELPSDHNFSEGGLYKFLERISFELLLYGVSFWIAVTYWLQQAAIMQYYRKGNRTLVWLNLLFLFPVTLLPFATELRGTYPHEELMTILFGFLQILIGISLIFIWNYSRRHPYLLACPIDDDFHRKVTYRMLISPVIISLIAMVFSYVNIKLSAIIFFTIPLYYLSHRELDQRWIQSDN
jgi:uncharacterized membrane protein